MTDEPLSDDQYCQTFEWRARGAIRQVEDSLTRGYALKRSDLNYGRAAAVLLQARRPGTDSDHLLRDVDNAIAAVVKEGLRVIEDVSAEAA